MITFDRDGARFVFRAAAALFHDGRVLLHRGERDAFWSLPGGRVEMRETSRDALERELREELALDATVGRLLFVIENFFDWRETRYHELGFYYLASPPRGHAILRERGEFAGVERDERLLFRWFAMAELPATELYPTVLRARLGSLPEATEHIVHRG